MPASRDIPVDFVTTHTYGVDGGFLDEKGQDDNKLSTNPDAVVGDVRRVREQIAASKFPGPAAVLHRMERQLQPARPGPRLLHQRRLHPDQAQARRAQYAQGHELLDLQRPVRGARPAADAVPGGFGLMNREGIRKAAWFAYKYLNELAGRKCRSGTRRCGRRDDGASVSAVVWDFQYRSRKVKATGPSSASSCRARNLPLSR